MPWGRPGGAGVTVASQPSNGRGALFAFDTGDTRVGAGTMPARRVALPLDYTSPAALTAEGWSLVDAAVGWAAGSPDDENTAPVVDAGADVAVAAGGTNVVAGTVTDDGLPGATVTTRWSGPAGVVFSAPGELSSEVSLPAPGTYVLVLTATDGELTSVDTTLASVNGAPSVNAGGDQLVAGSQAALTGSATDDGLPFGELVATWSGPSGVTFANPHTLTTAAGFPGGGVYVLTLSVTDSVSTTTDTVTVTVNGGPVVDAGADVVVASGSRAQLAGTVTDDGFPSAALAVAWSGPAGATFENAASVDTAVTLPGPGAYTLTLSADDGAVTVTDTVTVRVNGPPVVQAGPDQSVPPGHVVTLDATVGDDGLPPGGLTATWTASDPGVTFAEPGAPDTTATLPGPGSFTLTLTATDGVHTAADSIVVAVNTPPVVAAGPDLGVNLGAPIRVTGTAGDDGLPSATLDVEWISPAGVTFGSPRSLSTSVSVPRPGVYEIVLTADDGLAVTSDSMVLRVNGPPVLDAGSDVRATPGQAVTLEGFVADDGLPAGASLSVGWTGPGGVVFDDPATLSPVVTFPGPGTYSLTLTAGDTVFTVSDTVTVTVGAPRALFVSGTATGTGDQALIQHLGTKRGLDVQIVDDDRLGDVDPADYDLILISSSVVPVTVGARFASVAVPVIVWEPFLYPDMRMTAAGSAKRGEEAGQTQVKVVAPSHPLAAGLTGSPTVQTPATALSWGVPAASADVVATVAANAGRATVFSYSTGDAMATGTAPADRIALPWSYSSIARLSPAGYALVDAAVAVALGDG